MRVRWKVVAFWCLLFLFWYTYPTEGGSENITLDVYPKVSIAPVGKRASVRVRYRVPLHPDNRWRSLAWSDGLPLGSESKSMDGETDEVTRELFVELRTGHYIFVACVHRKMPGESKLKAFCANEQIEVR